LKRGGTDAPLRQWKLSTIDLPSRACDRMLEDTDSKHAPWYIVRSDNKKRARLNCMSHLLPVIAYQALPRENIKIPKRSKKGMRIERNEVLGIIG
jgi:polyphosphate kinase 2 (PPK2 family)